jgi:small subunit ribosomal protein S15
MALTKEKRKDLVVNSRRHEKDTGSSEVQVTLLTERINSLTDHFKTHKKDHHSETGLMKMVNRRKRLLKYLQENDSDRYQALIKKLNLRK